MGWSKGRRAVLHFPSTFSGDLTHAKQSRERPHLKKTHPTEDCVNALTVWSPGEEGGPRDLRRQKTWGDQRQAAGSRYRKQGRRPHMPRGNSSLSTTALRSRGKDLNHRTTQAGGHFTKVLELQLS